MFRIVVTETEHPAIGALVKQLSDKGYRLESVKSTEEMLERARAEKPDLLLLHVENLSLCRTIKDDPDTEDIQVIVVHDSENGAKTPIGEGFSQGAADFLRSDTHLDEMLARIQTALEQIQERRQTKNLVNQLNQMNAELYERNLTVEKELYTTRQLQQSLLPPILEEEKEERRPVKTLEGKTLEPTAQTRFAKRHYLDDSLKISGVYLPCDALGGDIYDVVKFPDETIGVAVADVSGHGVPAAFITAIFKASFYRTTHNYHEPGDILYHLNNELIDIVKTGQYITSIYCRIDQSGKRLHYSGAGHPYPFYYSAEKDSLFRLEENGTPLVWFKNMEFPMGEIMLAPGDKLMIFTDGISELKNDRDEMFGEDALANLFMRLAREGSPNILDDVMNVLSDFTEGHPLDDDISAVLVEAR